ncbi:vegetative cell wall protein gp1-like [Triticum dicoccoides]|uniref:vegetative cell wall protein gp1-like n=1 Tax=Triticum dicoccoides TaxID=85692 RepID=UPI001891EFC9|nr:vegetative cell wall protein gp1-like [Triticum dicoccoides]
MASPPSAAAHPSSLEAGLTQSRTGRTRPPRHARASPTLLLSGPHPAPPRRVVHLIVLLPTSPTTPHDLSHPFWIAHPRAPTPPTRPGAPSPSPTSLLPEPFPSQRLAVPAAFAAAPRGPGEHTHARRLPPPAHSFFAVLAPCLQHHRPPSSSSPEPPRPPPHGSPPLLPANGLDYETDAAATQYDYGVDGPSLPEQPGKPPYHQMSPILLSIACIRVV